MLKSELCVNKQVLSEPYIPAQRHIKIGNVILSLLINKYKEKK